MSVIPGGIDSEQGPPMAVPLRHFVVGLVFLLVGTLLGVGVALGRAPGQATLAHVHLLLVGWVCVTIMGAMTQFVPVWSGTTLHSRRLANVQLLLVVVGVTGFAGALLDGRLPLLAAFGATMLAGFWTFAYNVLRSLPPVRTRDVTERHFTYALVAFLALTAMGVLLALELSTRAETVGAVPHAQLLASHATLAVFGAVLTTVYGALYQLGTMFTQTDLHGVDLPLQRVAEVGHVLGVVLLVVGRFLDALLVARVGAVLVLVAACSVGAVLGRKLLETRVPWTPMHRRYAVVVCALVLWAVGSVPSWTSDPLAPETRLGAPGTEHLLLLGVFGFVILGTLYHVVPFLVWVDRYADRLGLEDVPMIDDLYDDRLAAVDLLLVGTGTGIVVAAEWFDLAATASALGGAFVTVGVAVFAGNLLLVLRRHGSVPFDAVVFGAWSPRYWLPWNWSVTAPGGSESATADRSESTPSDRSTPTDRDRSASTAQDRPE